ncbi:MAG TPA: sugar phosphate isomerase/epimerase family protein [Pirellulales bacterium]|jgi:sugar phosphate isomerase/epimerase|nr:sugar phosphate isomerase/epimerase family protein [Pirellulales bacterium]
MQLGFVSAILPEQSLAEVLTFAAEVGYECVEVMCWPPGKADRRYAGVTHLDATQFEAPQAEAIRALCRQTGVAISGLGYYPNLLAPDEEEARVARAHLEKVLQAAAVLGIGQVNTFIGRDWRRSVEDNWPRFVEVWKPLIRRAEELQVRIGIENCPMLFSRDEWPGGKNLATSPDIWRRMFAEIPSPYFGLNFDPSHLVWQQIDYVYPLREFAPRLFHLHAKDVRVDREHLNRVGILANPAAYHTPKLPGLGDVNWSAFFGMLGDIDYRGAVCVEVEDRYYEHSVAARKAALVQSYRYLRNFIPERMAK